MINRSGLHSPIKGDIFYIREKVINDIWHKNNLEKINQRQIDAIKQSKVKPKKNKKLKAIETSDFILPNINLFKNLISSPSENKKNISNQNTYNSNYNYDVNTIPNNSSDYNVGGLFLTNLSPVINANPFNIDLNSSSINQYPVVNSENTKVSKPKSIVSENNNYKFLFSYDNTNKDEFIKRYLESKQRSNLKKILEIEKENEFFIKRLKSVSSDLNREKLSSSYAKLCEYRDLARKSKTNKEIKDRIDNRILNHLPSIIFNRNPN